MVERAGGKAAVVRAAATAGGHWAGTVARLVGLSADAVALGVPVPLAHHLTTWADVAREVDADRCDVVVLHVDPAAAGGLLDAPDLLVRVLDARLEALAPLVGADPPAASEVADLLALRPDLLGLRGLAEAAVAAGHPEQHDGCGRPGGLGLPTVDRDAPAGPARAGVAVRADGDGFVLSLVVPPGAVPDLARAGDRLAVTAGPSRRTLRLPAALARCRVRRAVVVGDLLEVHLDPDPDAWR